MNEQELIKALRFELEKAKDAEYAILGWIARHKKGCSCNGCRYWVKYVDMSGPSNTKLEDMEKRFA